MKAFFEHRKPDNDSCRPGGMFQYNGIGDQHTGSGLLYQKLLVSGGIGTWELNFDEGYVDGCELFHSLFGIGKEKISLVRFWKAFNDTDRDVFRQAYEVACTTGLISFELKIPGKREHRPVWVRICGLAAGSQKKGISLLQGIIQAVSGYYEEESRASDMIDFVNHEIRSSVTALMLYVQQSRSTARIGAYGDTEVFLAKAEQRVNAIIKMTEAFLDSSVLLSGSFSLSVEEFDLPELLYEVALEFRSLYPGYNFLVITSAQVGVSADRSKMRQVLVNLTDNAVKYSPAGSTVTLLCHVQIDGITVTVRDQGIGVARHEVQKIFSKHHRVADKRTSSARGHGIGLFLLKKIIERHNGTVGVSNRLVNGSEFFFKLPKSRFLVT